MGTARECESAKREVGVSEAALYRHFPSKARMFEGLIDFIEESIFARITRILDDIPDATTRCGTILSLLLGFAEKPAHPTPMIGERDRALASTGIYVFDWIWLKAALRLEPAIVHAVSEIVFMGGTVSDEHQGGVEFNILVDPLAAREVLHAGIDVTDGLLADLGHVCKASGVGARLEAGALPLSPGVTLQHALAGGDDYELCVTAAADARLDEAIWTRIGAIVPAADGVACVDASGTPIPGNSTGYRHF